MDCCIELAIECCVASVASAVEGASEAEIERRSQHRASNGGIDPSISWILNQFPDCERKFPDCDDLTTAQAQQVHVWYVKIGNEIHRVSVNRVPTVYQPCYYFVNGVEIGRRAGSKQKKFQHPSEEVQAMYNPMFKADDCHDIVWISFKIHDTELCLVGGYVNMLNKICCYYIKAQPQVYELYVNGRSVLNSTKTLKMKKSCWDIFFAMFLLPWWCLWILISMIYLTFVCCFCCGKRGKVHRCVVKQVNGKAYYASREITTAVEESSELFRKNSEKTPLLE